jgi:hypothetical protein
MTAHVDSPEQVYRLALYGVVASGKTCILSALSLPRVANPKGFSCSWIEHVPGHSLPTGDPTTWTTDDPFHAGWKWLNEQRSRLKIGEVPAPNPVRTGPMRFLFDFGSRDHGIRHVELIDYSGELITVSAGELAAKLHDHMRDCDGLLVLAEVPHPDRIDAPLADGLEKLKSAFLLLLNRRDTSPRQDWPIALLFNKWDRRADADRDGYAEEQQLIKAFLDQSPPQLSLIDTITNAVGDENSRCFPVSAFGAHEIRGDGAEVPRLNGTLLKSRGLEDGFVWVADRCDAIQVERLEDAASDTSWWAFPQIVIGRNAPGFRTLATSWKMWFCGVSAASATSAAWKLRRRFPEKHHLRIRTTGALLRLGRKLISQLAVCLIVLLAFYFGIETTLDGISYRRILAVRDDPSAEAEELQLGETWLERYFVSPSYRHWLSCQTILDRSDAHILLVQFRIQREEALWMSVTDAKNPQTRLILARKYHDAFPAGLHQSEAQTVVADADRQEMQNKNEKYLEQIALKVDAIAANPTTPLDVLHSLNEQVGTIPHPEATSTSIETRQHQLGERIAQKQTQAVESVRHADWEKFKQSYFSLMQNNSVGDAARELGARVPKNTDLQVLVGDFEKQAPVIIHGKVQDALKNHSWQIARDSARLIANPNVVKLLPASAIKDLQKLGQEIDVAEDRDLYAQIRRYKPQCGDQIDAYLSRAPLKAMKVEVEKYRQYINAMKEPLDLTLSLTAIQWHDNYWAWRVSYYNDVTVQVKGKPSITATRVLSKANTRSAELGDGTMNAGFNETITIDVSVVAKYGWVGTSTMSGGSGSWTGTPNQLRSGVTIDLDGDGFTNKATFSLAGIPTEPTLPDWNHR